jgi:hypothetical protein
MADSEEKKFAINYLKVEPFNSRFVTGVIGGVTVNGMINMNAFLDRMVIPQKVVHAIDEKNKTLGEVVDQTTKEGIIREVHTGLVFDVKTAKEIINWLDGHISNIEKKSHK